MAAAEILQACLEIGSEAAWNAFVQRFQPLIASSVARVVRRYGDTNAALIDDLVQETYLRLCRDNCRTLRTFQAHHEEAIFGYLKVIATSVALDHFRARSSQKRRGEVAESDHSAEPVSPSPSIEQAVLLEEINRHLTAETERDRTIFWLYYRQGYTTKDIAAIPSLGLTQKGVESCIYRLTQMLRLVVTKKAGTVKGTVPPNTLGVMK